MIAARLTMKQRAPDQSPPGAGQSRALGWELSERVREHFPRSRVVPLLEHKLRQLEARTSEESWLVREVAVFYHAARERDIRGLKIAHGRHRTCQPHRVIPARIITHVKYWPHALEDIGGHR